MEICIKAEDSPFWRSLLVVKHLFYDNCRKHVGDGCNTRFWVDLWRDDQPLKVAYPRLFDLCFNKNTSVTMAFSLGLSNISFRRTLYWDSLSLWVSRKDRYVMRLSFLIKKEELNNAVVFKQDCHYSLVG